MSFLLKGILYCIGAQVLTFLQFQGGIKYGITEKHPWLLSLAGIPISYLFMMSVLNFVKAYDGAIWPSRLYGFGIGVIIFSIMSHLMFNEHINYKTLVCLLLALLIVIIQAFWK